MARFGVAIGIALFGLTLLLGSASAAETGTHAWTKNGVQLFQGPGTEYDLVGDLTGDIEVRVERCTYQWCKVRGEGQRGWMYRRALSFGQTSRGPFQGPKFNFGEGLGTVCLYTGRDYTGTELCRDSGFVMRDLLLFGNDDTYSSVRIEGSASVLLCRDAYFRNYCERVNESQPRINGFLDNNVSSVRIY
jgi:SH3 domain-containing protein/peptidase inhibitor family I36